MSPPVITTPKKGRVEFDSVAASSSTEEVRIIKSGPERLLESRNLIRDTVAELTSKHGPASLDLSLGDPSKYGGKFVVPDPLKNALVDVVKAGKSDGYAPALGDEGTRRALGARYGVDFSKVAITSGCSAALDMTFRALAGHDDAIMVPVPGFPLYETLLKAHGIQIIRYRLDPLDDWKVDLASFPRGGENCDRIKAIVICNPSNPTGSVYDEHHLREMMTIVKSSFPNATVVADQVYEDVVFDLTARFVDMGPIGLELGLPTVSVSGVAKGLHAPGWRMGWIVSFDRHAELDIFRKRVQNLANTTMGASTVIQHALKHVLLNHAQEIAEFRAVTNQALRESTEILVRGLEKIDGVQVNRPRGAMYVFFKLPSFSANESTTTTMSICAELLQKEGLLLLPGDVCFNAPKGYCRALMAIPPELARDAVQRITRFCQREKT